jgi:hypothetical protein
VSTTGWDLIEQTQGRRSCNIKVLKGILYERNAQVQAVETCEVGWTHPPDAA